MIIGVLKEIMHNERRVSAIPETVKKFTDEGSLVLVEKGAGSGAFFTDAQYKEAGAQIVDDPSEIFDRADVILKVKEPLFNEAKNKHEADMMHKGQYIITFIHPASPVNHKMVQKLAENGVTSLTLDGIPRISGAQNMDALTSMSTCAGYEGIVIAANHLPKFMPQIFCAAGMIKPVNTMIIGVGVAGLQALATAKRLGSVLYAADIRPDASEQAKSLGAKTVDLGVPREVAIGSGGYANQIPEKWLNHERDVLKGVIGDMDILFLSALVPGKIAPVIITDEMVKSMRPGSVIVDISIDQGGNCESTKPGEIDVKHGVTIVGIKNIPGMLPTSSTWMFANNMYNLMKHITKDGKIVLDMNDQIVKSILVTVDGKLVHEGTKEAMGIK
ncbi:MAG: NAD(P) transhydrogenase subunit alpha [Firmicutes bacterium ADurb.Bin182]|nr:MAG: NAD(P) transhydrogenase subunit alpha [Firmicutes bacterium ADurb.Bin182]